MTARAVSATCLVLGGLALASLPACAQQTAQRVGHAFSPANREATEARIRQLRVPEGFRVEVFARDLGSPRMMQVGNDGTVYVTRFDEDDVLALSDRDGDGRADDRRTIASDLGGVHGIAIRDGRMYLATVRQVLVAEMRLDGSIGALRTIVDGLPDGGQHPKRTIGFDADGRLYISVGSSCNACEEDDAEHATMLRTQPDGSGRTVFARGLRNTIGFAWHPETGALWGMDHGSDWRGDDQPPEELNRLQQGKHYGWPYCFADRQPDPVFAGKKSDLEQFCSRKTEGAAFTYTAHAAPIAFVFYTGDRFPKDYRNDAFVTFHGSWNRRPAAGYKVVRVRFEDGRPVAAEDFLSGFLIEDGTAQFGRPAGLAVTRDGALLVSDDSNGAIYRVSYSK